MRTFYGLLSALLTKLLGLIPRLEQCHHYSFDDGRVHRCDKDAPEWGNPPLCAQHERERLLDHNAYHDVHTDAATRARLRHNYANTYGFGNSKRIGSLGLQDSLILELKRDPSSRSILIKHLDRPPEYDQMTTDERLQWLRDHHHECSHSQTILDGHMYAIVCCEFGIPVNRIDPLDEYVSQQNISPRTPHRLLGQLYDKDEVIAVCSGLDLACDLAATIETYTWFFQCQKTMIPLSELRTVPHNRAQLVHQTLVQFDGSLNFGCCAESAKHCPYV